MNEIQTLEALTLSLQDKHELLIDLMNQIIKDFEAFQLPLQLSGSINSVIHELNDQIESNIIELQKKDSERLMSLLYKIDIPENILQHAMEKYPGENYSRILSLLIINRELQKVIFRNQFKQ